MYALLRRTWSRNGLGEERNNPHEDGIVIFPAFTDDSSHIILFDCDDTHRTMAT